MSDRQILVDELIRDEGIARFPYQDTGGVWTIGCGRNLTAHGISDGEAMLFLDHDIDDAIRDLTTFPWFLTLDPVRQRALTNLRFNLGAAGFRSFRRLIAAMAVGDYAQAEASMRASLWHRQVGARAVRLEQMMRTGATA
jgi:lysozyme